MKEDVVTPDVVTPDVVDEDINHWEVLWFYISQGFQTLVWQLRFSMIIATLFLKLVCIRLQRKLDDYMDF